MASIYIKAACAGNIPKLKVLLEGEEDINTRDSKGRTALFAAAGTGQLVVIEKLIEVGARVNARNRKRWTPLHNAAFNGQTEALKLLIKSGADVNKCNLREATPLMLACRTGSFECAEVLLREGCSVNSKDMYGRHALHWAVKGGDPNIAKLLIECKANVNVKDNWGKSPTFQAAKSNRPEILKYLMGIGGKTSTDRNGKEAIHVAAEKNSASAIKVLIEGGVCLDKPLESGRTPLMEAAYNGNFAAIQVLINSGADVNGVDAKGSNALHHLMYGAILTRQKLPWFEGALFLLQQNADIDALTNHPIFSVYLEPEHPQNAIEMALKAGFTQFVKAFAMSGSDLGNVRIYMNIKSKELTSYVAKQSRTLDLIRRIYKKPFALKVLSRKSFRTSMPSRNFANELEQLNLAPGLRKYVMFSDLEEQKEIRDTEHNLSDCSDEEDESDLFARFPEKSPSPDSDSGMDYEPSLYDSNDHIDRIPLDSD